MVFQLVTGTKNFQYQLVLYPLIKIILFTNINNFKSQKAYNINTTNTNLCPEKMFIYSDPKKIIIFLVFWYQ